MSAPLIGITATRNLNRSGDPLMTVAEAYTQAVAQAGACPVILPLGLPENILEELLSRLDGILFSGGGDVEPDRYGSTPHPLVAEVDADRDRVEIHLLQNAVRTGLPFLGICRGLQVINVAMGGTLYEDILDQHPNALRHQYGSEKPRNYLAHPVQVKRESRLAKVLGDRHAQVNSLHHQGIQRLAPGLQASAYAPDGIIEAFELPDYPFGVAVQWHPEWLVEHPEMRAIFNAFARAADVKRDE